MERGVLARETHFTADVVVGGNTLQMSVKVHTFFLPRKPCILNLPSLYIVHPEKVGCVSYLLCCKGTGSGGLAI